MFGETLVADTILGKYIADGLDWSYKKIIEKIKKKKEVNSHENDKTKMYQAIINAFNKIAANNSQNNEEKIYMAAEKFLQDWKSGGKLDQNIPIGSLKIILPKVDENTCMYFINLLNEEMIKNEELMKYFIIDKIIEIKNDLADTKGTSERIEKKVDRLLEYKQKEDNISANNNSELDSSIIFKDNKQEYIDKWNAKLFLQKKDDKRELLLNNTFMMPEYMKDGDRKGDLEDRLTSFFSNNKRTMLILGFPGMGKTSIIACLANKYRNNEQFLMLKFSAISKGNLVDDKSLLEAISIQLGCTEKDLEEKILILDGFDEIKYSGNTHDLLRIFFLDIKNINSFKVILTSRVNYINTDSIKVNEVILLAPFSSKQIGDFHEAILGKKLSDNLKINREVLGIPVILYMALMVGIDIQSNGSRTEIYEKIFALEGGIFDRFESEENESYQKGSHKVEYEKEKLHRVLQILAFEMFKTNKGVVSKKEYVDLVKSVKDINEDIIFDFPIKNLYEEGSGIEYVHKSIYEYFLAEYIYQSIKMSLKNMGGNVESLAGVLGNIINNNIISQESEEFLKYKIKTYIIKNKTFNLFSSAFILMLENGMMYYTHEVHKNVIEHEINVFINMLKIIHFEKLQSPNLYYLSDLSYMQNQQLENYIKYSLGTYLLDLRQINLKRIILSERNLKLADMRGADLTGADLERTNLRLVLLNFADLSKADLRLANLKESDFNKLININKIKSLNDTIFDSKNIKQIEFIEPVLVHQTKVEFNGKIIPYDEYKKLQKENIESK